MPYIGTSPSNGVRRVHTYTATASQTTFTGASSEGVTLSYVDTNYIDVFQNGVLLGSADYTSTSGTSVVLAQGASVDDLIVIVVYDVFSVADTVSKADGGTFDGNVTMGGALGVTGASTLTGALSAKGGAVFNEDSASVDFRIESNDDANMFFLDGSANAIGIRTSTDHGGQLNVETTGQAYNVVLACTDDDANHGPLLDFKRISSSPADGDLLGEISFRGRNDNTEDITYATISSTLKDASDGTEDGNLFFNVMVAGTSRELLTVTKDSVVINQDSQDIDFRVESDGSENALFLDAANDRLHLFGTDGNPDNNTGSNRNGVIKSDGSISFASYQLNTAVFNRLNNDGTIVSLRQNGSQEGTISVSGSTVSYNAFSGSHWSRLTDNSKPIILKGTIIETIDEMCDWHQVQFDVDGNTKKVSYTLKDGEKVGDKITYTYESNNYNATILQETDSKHTKCKIAETADSKRVYGVFADWDNDDDTVNDMYVTAVGTHVVRINKDITVKAGDLLSSNGDGTAKVQDDDIIRSKTIGKVLTNIKQETYSDGSYTVPCALYCG